MKFELDRLSCKEPPIKEALRVEDKNHPNGYYYTWSLHTLEDLLALSSKVGHPVEIQPAKNASELNRILILDGWY